MSCIRKTYFKVLSLQNVFDIFILLKLTIIKNASLIMMCILFIFVKLQRYGKSYKNFVIYTKK